MQKLSELLDVIYPSTMILNQQILNEKGINFVSSKGINNGVSAKIQETDKHKKYSKYAITVALKGSVLSSFVQPKEFYIAHQTAVLYPKSKLTENELIYYCLSIRANKYRFNYGRQADRTLKDLLLPSKNEIPEWVNETDYKFDENLTKPLNNLVLKLDTNNWQAFTFDRLFRLFKGKRLTKAQMHEGETPYISSSSFNNGVDAYISEEPNFKKKFLTFACYGSIGEVFYHPYDAWVSDNCNVMYLKNYNLNVYIAIFLIGVIKKEKYRFSYGFTGKLQTLKKLKIKLPSKEGQPDFEFMESYIKSLPYSNSI